MKLKKKETDIWTGTYKGIGFEINNWKTPPNSIEPNEKDCWTYYIYLHINRIPKKNNPNSYWIKGKKDRSHVHYDYYAHNVINELDWHGGITWYSKERGFDGSEKVIKIGCDYGHLWDQGQYYNLDIVKSELQNTIERFLNYVPDYKHWCCGNGNLYKLSEGIMKNEQFYSKEYWGDKEWFKELIIK